MIPGDRRGSGETGDFKNTIVKGVSPLSTSTDGLFTYVIRKNDLSFRKFQLEIGGIRDIERRQ